MTKVSASRVPETPRVDLLNVLFTCSFNGMVNPSKRRRAEGFEERSRASLIRRLDVSTRTRRLRELASHMSAAGPAVPGQGALLSLSISMSKHDDLEKSILPHLPLPPRLGDWPTMTALAWHIVMYSLTRRIAERTHERFIHV